MTLLRSHSEPHPNCPRCNGPWIPRDHEFMGRIVEDKRCLFCGETIYHRGVPKRPRRKSGKAGKIRLCLGCELPLEWDAGPLKKYHNRQCKWMAEKGVKSGRS